MASIGKSQACDVNGDQGEMQRMARDGPDEVSAGPNDTDHSGSMRFIRWAMGSYQK